MNEELIEVQEEPRESGIEVVRELIGSNIQIDPTLTIEGAAADAKAAGDAIAAKYTKPAAGIPASDLAGLNAGNIAYDDTETYQSGTVGSELGDLSRQLSNVEESTMQNTTADADIMLLNDMLFRGRENTVFSDDGRVITQNKNVISYKRTGSGSTYMIIPLTGNTTTISGSYTSSNGAAKRKELYTNGSYADISTFNVSSILPYVMFRFSVVAKNTTNDDFGLYFTTYDSTTDTSVEYGYWQIIPSNYPKLYYANLTDFWNTAKANGNISVWFYRRNGGTVGGEIKLTMELEFSAVEPESLNTINNRFNIKYTRFSGYLHENGNQTIDQALVSYVSDIIPCVEGDVFNYSGLSSTPTASNSHAAGYILYNNGSLVSSHKLGNVSNYNIRIPTGVNGIKFASYNFAGTAPDIVVEKKPPLEIVAASELFNSKINVLGDSYVANNGQPVSDTWHYKLASKFHMTYRNYGVNGCKMIGTDSNAMSVRYANMSDDADYILVIGGTNDFNTQTTITDFKTGLEIFIQNLVSKYPTGKLVFFTIFNSLNQLNPASSETKTYELIEYNDAIVEICNKYSVPVYNAWSNSGMRAWEESFRTAYFQSSTDRAHLNSDGHNRFLPIAESFMKSIG